MTTKTQKPRHYKGNTKLKGVNVKNIFTPEQIDTVAKCMADPVYFIENFVKIVHVDQGIIPFKMWDFQKNIVELYNNNRHVILKLPRQCGKTQTTAAFI